MAGTTETTERKYASLPTQMETIVRFDQEILLYPERREPLREFLDCSIEIITHTLTNWAKENYGKTLGRTDFDVNKLNRVVDAYHVFVGAKGETKPITLLDYGETVRRLNKTASILTSVHLIRLVGEVGLRVANTMSQEATLEDINALLELADFFDGIKINNP